MTTAWMHSIVFHALFKAKRVDRAGADEFYLDDGRRIIVHDAMPMEGVHDSPNEETMRALAHRTVAMSRAFKRTEKPNVTS